RLPPRRRRRPTSRLVGDEAVERVEREPRDDHDGRDEHDLEEQHHGSESSGRGAKVSRRPSSAELPVLRRELGAQRVRRGGDERRGEALASAETAFGYVRDGVFEAVPVREVPAYGVPGTDHSKSRLRRDREAIAGQRIKELGVWAG